MWLHDVVKNLPSPPIPPPPPLKLEPLQANAYSVESAVNMFMESGGEGAVGGEARGEGGGVSGMGEEGTR